MSRGFTQVVVVLVIVGLCLFGFLWWKSMRVVQVLEAPEATVTETVWMKSQKIGTSVENRSIEAYTYGDGKNHLLFVGGIHGGYEWNSVLLAYEMMDYLSQSSSSLPKNLKITVIPSANPDGVAKVVSKDGRFTKEDVIQSAKLSVGLGRFNANNVDLNRNFDCKWQATSTWRSTPVSAGMSAFSEPEAQAIRDFIKANPVKAVVFWHSQANAVYASECENGILPETRDIMNAYSKASGYKAVDVFDAYPVTGDAEGWLASIGIPAITVELSTHEDIEWENNFAGFKALVQYYTNK